VNVKHANQQFLIEFLSFGVRSYEKHSPETMMTETMMTGERSTPYVLSLMNEEFCSESAYGGSWPISDC
jgi:hypothetical protein